MSNDLIPFVMESAVASDIVEVEDRSDDHVVRLRVHFKNGYGASIIHGQFFDFGTSYGYEDGLLEVAVLKQGRLCYSNPIASDVLGHMNREDVLYMLSRIKNLPKSA